MELAVVELDRINRLGAVTRRVSGPGQEADKSLVTEVRGRTTSRGQACRSDRTCTLACPRGRPSSRSGRQRRPGAPFLEEGPVPCQPFALWRRQREQRRTGRAHQQVDRLDDVDKGLVLAVLDVCSPPAGVARRLDGNLRRVLALCEPGGNASARRALRVWAIARHARSPGLT